ncbi:hypothetical protein JOS77_08370 [Chromobacterium haemolyticum]|nr:hypothetical protein JOS77_08370 [Chromobacterium haemolyticum]
MPPDLAEWFAELPPDTPSGDTDSPSDDDTTADPLALPWCQMDGPELSGAALYPGQGLPLLCQGCTALTKGKCQHLTAAPTYGQAAHCYAFQPLPGVFVGCCWLWRLTLLNGQLIWWSHLPPINQTTMLWQARQRYGATLIGVHPLPGWKTIPSLFDLSQISTQ